MQIYDDWPLFEAEPMFESLDAMCEAFGWDEATRDRIRADMQLTAPLGVNAGTLH